MRLIRIWTYSLGTKPPFSEMPELVHRFMAKHGLTNRAFMYYFKDYIFHDNPYVDKTKEQQIATAGCTRAFKACLSFGQPRYFHNDNADELILSNIDTGGGCTEEDIMPLMKQIHKRWGFVSSSLYYDIDFFGDVIPWEHIENPLYSRNIGSGIVIERECSGKQYITFSIDLLHNGVVHDPTPYIKTMKELLPRRRPDDFLEIVFTEEEKREYAALQTTAEPLADECESWLKDRLPDEDGNTPSGWAENKTETLLKASINDCRELFRSAQDSADVLFPQYKMAPVLKAIAKRYKFTYQYIADGLYHLSYKTARGHSLVVGVDSGPSHTRADFFITFEGLGFSHCFHSARFFPSDQVQFDACAEYVFSVVDTFIAEALDPLVLHYPDTPDWYQPGSTI